MKTWKLWILTKTSPSTWVFSIESISLSYESKVSKKISKNGCVLNNYVSIELSAIFPYKLRSTLGCKCWRRVWLVILLTFALQIIKRIQARVFDIKKRLRRSPKAHKTKCNLKTQTLNPNNFPHKKKSHMPKHPLLNIRNAKGTNSQPLCLSCCTHTTMHSTEITHP